MFKVWFLDDPSGNQYTVYQIQEDKDGTLYFLLYKGGAWNWYVAERLAPVD